MFPLSGSVLDLYIHVFVEAFAAVHYKRMQEKRQDLTGTGR